MQLSRTRGRLRMSRHSISNSLWLRTQPFSFLDGATAVFDWRPLTDQYNVSSTPQSANARAMAADFYAVGDDMRAALSDYGRTQRNCANAPR